jgi:hypothetical protein
MLDISYGVHHPQPEMMPRLIAPGRPLGLSDTCSEFYVIVGMAIVMVEQSNEGRRSPSEKQVMLSIFGGPCSASRFAAKWGNDRVLLAKAAATCAPFACFESSAPRPWPLVAFLCRDRSRCSSRSRRLLSPLLHVDVLCNWAGRVNLCDQLGFKRIYPALSGLLHHTAASAQTAPGPLPPVAYPSLTGQHGRRP